MRRKASKGQADGPDRPEISSQRRDWSRVSDEKGLKALAHPLRRTLLQLLEEGPASPSVLATRVGEPTARVHHHMQVLLRAGLIRAAGERRSGRTRWKDYERVSSHIWVEPDLFGPDGPPAAWSHLASRIQGLNRIVDLALSRARAEGPRPGETLLESTVTLDDRVARALPQLLAHFLLGLESLGRGGPDCTDPRDVGQPESGEARYHIAILSLALPPDEDLSGDGRS